MFAENQRRDRFRPRLGRPRIRTGILLAAIALLPLTGAGWFAADELRTASTVSREVVEIDPLTEELVLVTDLRTRLLDEKNWSTVILGLTAIGFSPDMTVEFTGIDIAREHAAAIEDVDAILPELGISELTTTLTQVRALTQQTDRDEVRSQDLVGYVTTEYGLIEDTILARSDGVLDRLLNIAGGVDGGEQLVTSLRVLEAASLARQAFASQLIGYFVTQFDTVVLDNLIEQSAVFGRAVQQIERLAPAESRSAEGLAAINTSGETAEFVEAVDELISVRLAGTASAEDVSLTTVLGQFDEIVALYATGSSAADAHLALVEAAGADVTDGGGDLLDHAANERFRAQMILAALVFASVVLAVLLTRAIVKPLRQLATSARLLRHGRIEVAVESRGPVEVREAAEAILEAAAYLQLVERQAMALADGDLENPTLAQEAPGSLGRSLQSAVKTLALSMNDGEEYRAQLAHEATHDTLTHLPNRKASLSWLKHSLSRSSRTNTELAVLFLDLDEFKDVNDLHGHQAGDIVLKTVAERMVATVRDCDHVGRLGGDEFLVIAEPVDGVEGALALGERLRTAIAAPIDVGATTVRVGASIGVALPGEEGLTPDEILRNADFAVYKAKDTGRGRTELCDEDLRVQMTEKADLEKALHAAIARNELVLDYQPIVDPPTMGVVSLEALVRWNRPGHGRLRPAAFIPVAERSDLIVELDLWVFTDVARQLAEWSAAERSPDGHLDRVSVSINVSSRSLNSPHFVDSFLEIFARYGVDARRVIVEITESALLDDIAIAAIQLDTLRSAGVRVAIDDFGTGYTSLAHLRNLPIDILKIDRSFTADPTAESLVKLIIDTGHLLDARITAEGIETQEQADRLIALGCDELQGFFYGHPEPAERLAAGPALSVRN